MVNYSKVESTNKINEWIKKYLYNWIQQNPKVVQYPIANDCLKISIEGHSEPHVVPKLLLQVSVRELRNIMVSPPEEDLLSKAIDVDNNIIISYSTLRSFPQTQLKKVSARYKVMCGFECYISVKIIHSSLLSCCDINLRKIKDMIQNAQNQRYDEITNCLFETL